MGRPVGRRGESRARLLDAALALFAEHGVSGTSLQMIADSLGVTKAAVYHQFASKSDIVLAVASPVMDQMASIADAADATEDKAARFDVVLTGLVDLVLDNRASASALRRDPVLTRLLETNDGFRAVLARINAILIGPNPSTEGRIALVLAGGSLMVTGMDPTLADVDRDTMRGILISSMKRLLRP